MPLRLLAPARFAGRVLWTLIVLLVLPRIARADDPWLRVETPRFTLLSNAPEKKIRALSDQLLAFDQFLSTQLPLPPRSATPLTILAFKDAKSFEPFQPRYDGKVQKLSGYFQPGDDRDLIAVNLQTADDWPLANIFHEYTHAYTRRVLGPAAQALPVWLREGLAEVYSTTDLSASRVRVGRPLLSHRFVLQRDRLLPLTTLLSVTDDSPIYSGGRSQDIFYAQSWALAHYLLLANDDAYAGTLESYLRALAAGTPPRTLDTWLEGDVSRLSRKLAGYVAEEVRGSGFKVRGSGFKVQGSRFKVRGSGFVVAQMSPADVHLAFGSLLRRTRRFDEAEVYLKRAAALAPAMPEPFEELGFLALRLERPDQAFLAFERALARGSRNGLAHLYVAEGLRRRANIRDLVVTISSR